MLNFSQIPQQQRKKAKTPNSLAVSHSGTKTPPETLATDESSKSSRIRKRARPSANEEGLSEKEQREQKVLFIRHKLQKCFLQSDSTPTPSELAKADNLLAELETFPNLEWSVVRDTKIYTALKKIVTLPSVPEEQEYDFKRRCAALIGALKRNREAVKAT